MGRQADDAPAMGPRPQPRRRPFRGAFARLRAARLRYRDSRQSFLAALGSRSRRARVTRSMDDGDGDHWR